MFDDRNGVRHIDVDGLRCAVTEFYKNLLVAVHRPFRPICFVSGFGRRDGFHGVAGQLAIVVPTAESVIIFCNVSRQCRSGALGVFGHVACVDNTAIGIERNS